jgi:hypothetical protein
MVDCQEIILMRVRARQLQKKEQTMGRARPKNQAGGLRNNKRHCKETVYEGLAQTERGRWRVLHAKMQSRPGFAFTRISS